MNTPLEQVLLKGSKKELMIAYLKDHPGEVEEAIQLAISDQKKLSWRAAWVLSEILPEQAHKISLHIDKILEVLPEFEDGHQRELIKVLQQCDLDEDQESLLYDHCVNIWEQIRKQPSVRYKAFEIMAHTSDKYPELIHEVLMLTEPQFVNSLSPGIRNGVLRLIRALEKKR